MKENALVIENLSRMKKAGKPSALATVVRVWGSAYRREGSKMVIDAEGNTTGMISGGCLEADVAERAKQVLESGTPVLQKYDMDEDLVWGLGLGCPGKVQVYIEPFL